MKKATVTSNVGESPKVSILMAAFNEEESVGQAIESIIDQTFHYWELIVIDDGSHDKTAEIVRQFSLEDSRITLLVNDTNIGLPGSLNKGLEIARGIYIARADADDTNMPNRLEIQFEFMQRNPEIDVLGTGAWLVNRRMERVRAIQLPESHLDLKKLGFLKTMFFHSSVMARKSFFDEVGFYDASYLRVQDKELWLRGLSLGAKYSNLPEPLIEYSTNGYIRSWRSIVLSTKALLRMAKIYKIKNGKFLVLLSLVAAILVKYKLRIPKTLRP